MGEHVSRTLRWSEWSASDAHDMPGFSFEKLWTYSCEKLGEPRRAGGFLKTLVSYPFGFFPIYLAQKSGVQITNPNYQLFVRVTRC